MIALATAVLASFDAVAQDDFNFEAYALANGLEVILVEDHTAPVVTVDVWYRVGSANDPTGRSGFAHLFEHMMFQGTANLGKDEFQRLIDNAGGDFNAYTSLDHTGYHLSLPSHQLPLGLWLEADRMASLAITQTNLDNQRAVVISEYLQNYGSSPYGLGILALTSDPYKYAPYQRSTVGAIEDLNLATVAELTDFHDTYYVPNNATLVVAGDFDPGDVRQLITQFFSPIPAGATPPSLAAWVPAQQVQAKFQTLQDDLIRIPAVMIGYEGPPRQHPDYPALQILNSILSVGDSSRLQQSLVETGLAVSANSFVRDNLGPSLFGAILLPNLGVIEVEELEALFYDELDRILTDGVPEAELDKAINILRASRISSLESTFGLAEQVQRANRHYGDPAAVLSEIDRFDAVTSDDIARVIRGYLDLADRQVIYVMPGEPEQRASPQPFVGAAGTPDDDAFDVHFAIAITEPPPPLAAEAFRLPPITENTLANGLEVIVIEAPELPVVTIDLLFRGGRALEPAEQTGLLGVLADLLTRGTRSRSALEIALEIESTGGGIYSYASSDLVAAGVFALVDDRRLAFELLGDVALNPTFPQEELDVLLTRRRTSLEGALSDPGQQAGRAFRRLAYGDHPYGRQITLDTLAAIDRTAVETLYSVMATPRNAVLIVAGKITTEEALELADSNFGNWTGGDQPVIDFPAAGGEIGPLEIVLVDVPGAEQADISLGNISISGTNPDRYVLSVMNTVLGGGLSSRLNQNLREEKGFSYSIRSSFTFPRDVGLFRISANVRPETTAEAITEILYELDRLRDELVPMDELVSVRDGMVGEFALGLETYRAFVGTVGAYLVRGLPISDIAIYPGRIGEADPESVMDRATRYLPTNLLVVVAGDADVLLGQLQAIGSVTVIDPR